MYNILNIFKRHCKYYIALMFIKISYYFISYKFYLFYKIILKKVLNYYGLYENLNK